LLRLILWSTGASSTLSRVGSRWRLLHPVGRGIDLLAGFCRVSPLWGFLAGRDPGPEPEAQGPPIDADGEMAVRGAFRFTRHPGNLGALGIFLFFPRMTVNRAVLAALAALYVVLGSMHEEQRLRAAYGAAYERHRRSAPLLIPRRPRR
jgi:hypothetical protein